MFRLLLDIRIHRALLRGAANSDDPATAYAKITELNENPEAYAIFKARLRSRTSKEDAHIGEGFDMVDADMAPPSGWLARVANWILTNFPTVLQDIMQLLNLLKPHVVE